MRVLPLGLTVLLLAVGTAAAAAACPPDVPAPDVAFRDMAGSPHNLSTFRGQVVLLEFWASWCIPCRKGFPFLDDLQARHAKDGVKVLAVTLEEDDDAVKGFLDAHPASFLVGRDPSGKAGEQMEVAAMPTTFLIDREGKIVSRYEGGTEAVHERLRRDVESLLAARPVEGTAVVAAKGRRHTKGSVRAWERGFLADPIMNLDGAPLDRAYREHIHASKEAAAGDGGVAGGGCGCN